MDKCSHDGVQVCSLTACKAKHKRRLERLEEDRIKKEVEKKRKSIKKDLIKKLSGDVSNKDRAILVADVLEKCPEIYSIETSFILDMEGQVIMKISDVIMKNQNSVRDYKAR